MQITATTAILAFLSIASPTTAHGVPATTPASAQPRETQAVPAPILALINAFSAARANFDAKALDALLAPDYVEVSPLGEVDRRQTVLGFYTLDKATPAPPMTLGTQDVRRYGNITIVIGSVDYRVPDQTGATVIRTMRVTYVARRVGNRWLMASAQYTGVRRSRPVS